ncbi:MAG: diphosphomevalonate decarboxylase [Cryobacterium sp.]|uniref:diphosphomevalonate decarboxylase n=1 Tax=Cryobacterium sp. TaxID=1926290 RepID=UPI0022A29DC0|nr:diphosphomevalonate decarboxylase [Cryobacterium sp.]MCY7403465.1 diphosphomevalonate decarboxylase [Cryobacterium sp.]
MDTPVGGPTGAAARAHSNIALIKYWGKRDEALNVPAVGSISITLDALSTDTRVTFVPGLRHDEFWLNDQRTQSKRVLGVLNLVRERAGLSFRARVTSTNNFPTGAGLASSASGFAALAVAASAAAGLTPSTRELSILARRGSGSAARSIYGGYVEMHTGTRPDGMDAFAEPVLDTDPWPLSVVVAITSHTAKTVSSTLGMAGSRATSPFYPAWVDTAKNDLADMRAAIATLDFPRLGELAEYSCLKLHALMLTSRPPLIYWNAGTVAAMHTVHELRQQGIAVYFTIDAGPQVKALCAPADAALVARALAETPGVQETRTSALGPGAYLMGAQE